MSPLSLVPPLAVFIIGFITRRMRFALLVGIVIGALISTQVDLLMSVQLVLHHFMHALELDQGESITSVILNDRMSILICLIFFGILTEIICESNAAVAFQNYSRSFVSDKRSAETSCILLSFLLCIDDYLSAIVVGSVMRPIADRFSIARAKLAYLCNSLSSPMAAVIPFSSWSAAIVGILMESGISEHGGEAVLIGSPYGVFLNMIPYTLYSLVLIVSVIFIVRKNVSFSLMKQCEVEASSHVSSKALCQNESEGELNTSAFDFTLPIASLLTGILLGFLYSGGYTLFGGEATFVQAILSAKVSQSLLMATLAATVISLAYYLARGTYTLRDCPGLIVRGSLLMISAILMLALTWTLTGLLKDELHTGAYIASLIGSWIPFVLLPLIVFWLTCGGFFLIGSAWGTMAILMPIVVSMLVAMNDSLVPQDVFAVPLLLPTLAAVVSGSVFGNHVSLISDTSLMASTSTNCNTLEHFKTKFMYALPVFTSSSLGFLIAGIYPEGGAILPLSVAMATAIAFTMAWQQIANRQEAFSL